MSTKQLRLFSLARKQPSKTLVAVKHATLALGQTEPTLHFHTFAFIPIVPCLISDLVLSRTYECRTGQPDAAPCNRQVSPHSGRSYLLEYSWDSAPPACGNAMTLFDDSRLVVGIKGTELQQCPPAHNADIQLCAELHRLAGVSSHDRMNERMADADRQSGREYCGYGYRTCTFVVHRWR